MKRLSMSYQALIESLALNGATTSATAEILQETLDIQESALRDMPEFNRHTLCI